MKVPGNAGEQSQPHDELFANIEDLEDLSHVAGVRMRREGLGTVRGVKNISARLERMHRS
jgi:hypothetical protein